MAGNIPMGSMSTEIKLNGSQSVKTLRELKQAVTQATSAWKAQRAELSNIGKSTEAAEAKYKGLGEAIKKQKDYISGLQVAQKHLENAQQSVDRTTKEGRQEYGKYNEALQKNETRLHSAQQKLASLTTQQTKAKSSLSYYKSGLAEAQKTLKTTTAVTKSYVDRLESEGNHYKANGARISGYRSSISNLTKQYEIQSRELKRIASESGATSEAYKRQQIRVNETATSLNKAKSAVSGLEAEQRKINPTPWDRLKAKISSVNKESQETHRTLKEVFMGSALGNVVSNAVSNLGSSLKSAYTEGMNLNLAIAKINGRFKGMGMNTRQIQALDKQIGELKSNTDLAGDSASNLQAHMLNWSTIGFKGAMQMAKTIAGVGDSSKMTGQQIDQMSAGLQRIGSTGKVTYSSLSRITKAAPTFMATLARGAGMSESKLRALLKTGNVTQKQFQTWIAKSSKYADESFKGYGQSQAGALKSMTVARQKLEQEFTKPIFDAKTSGLQALKNIMTSKEVMSGANQLGKAISNIIGYLDKHKGDIVAITKNVVSLGVEVGKAVWKDFAAIIQNIGKALGIAKGNGKDSSSALHTLATATADLAKNKTAVKAISDAIIAMVAIKGIGKVSGGLFSIGRGAVAAYKSVKALHDGFKGIELAKDATAGAKAWAKFGGVLSKTSDKLTGLLQSTHSAGGFKNLSTAGKIGTGLAGAGVAIDSGASFFKAFQDRHSADKRSQDIGKGIGAGIGGGIGLYFGGPLGAALGAKVGGFIGKWGGEGVNQFTKGWQSQGKKVKPQNWVQWLGFQAHNSFDFFIGLGKKAVTAVGKGFNSAKSFAKKNSKELALTAVSPLLGIPALLYKNNPKFRKWANGIGKNIKSGLSKAGKAINNFKSLLSKNFKKAWDNVYKHSSKGTKQIMRSVSRFAKSYIKTNSKANKETIKNFASFSKRLKKNHGDLFKTIGQTAKKQLAIEKRRWSANWKNISRTAKGIWNGIHKNASDLYKKLNSATHGGLGKVFSGFKSFGTNLKNFWSSLLKGIQSTFSHAIDNIKGAANNVNKFFHGKLKVGSLHLANGTDWRKKYGTPAVVNDAPGENYREGLLVNGQVIPFPDKRNIPFWLLPGQDIVNGNDMAKMFGHAVHYADGTVHLSKDHKYSKKNYELAKKRAVEDKKELDKLGDKISNALKHKDGNEARRLTKEFNKLTKKYSADKKAAKKPDPHAGKVLVDQGLLIGAKSRIGHSVYISKDLFKKLITNLNKKKSTTRRRTTTHKRRSTTARRISTRRYSSRVTTPRISSGVSARISTVGLGSINSLSKALKRIKSKSIKVVAKASGTKAVTSLAKSVGKVKGSSHKVIIKTSGLTSLRKLAKAANKIKGKTHKVRVRTSGTKGLKSLQKNITSVHKRIDSLSKASKKDKFGKAIAKQAEEAVKSLKGKGNFTKQFNSMVKKFEKDLKAMVKTAQKEFKSMWSNMEHSSKTSQSSMLHSLSSFSKKFKHDWSSLQSGVYKSFSHFWTNMRSAAGRGVNNVIRILNSAIGKIDNVISDFGGSKTAVHKSGYVHYAGGTDANGRLTQDTLAIVNDAKSGPRQEAIITDTNDVLLPRGKDVPVMLKKGWGVLNGTQTQQLGLPHFANGTGLKGLYKLAKKYWNHPVKTGQSMFGAISGLSSAIKDLALGMRNTAEKSGVNWWSQLWKMVADKVNDDAVGKGGTREAFLKYAEKVFSGVHYQMGAASKTLSDCSGMVMQALRHFGINIGRTTVAMQESNGVQYLGKNIRKTVPGDLVIFGHGTGAAGHVGIIKNPKAGTMFNETQPYARVSRIADDVSMGYGFYRVKGLHNASDSNNPKVKANNSLQSLIKKQVGQGFWRTIQKIADKYGENSFFGGMAGKPVGDVTHWMRQAHIPKKDWAGINYIVTAESGWNPRIVNPSSGTYGLGQMQGYNLHYYTRHGSKSNPIAQLMGIMDYIHDRYGSVANAVRFRKAHNWYANGGIASTPSIFGEAGPEMAIPLIPSKSTRAWELIGKAIAILSANTTFGQQQNQIDSKEQKEEHEFRQSVLLLLRQIFNKSSVADIKLTTPAGRTLWEVVEPFSKAEQRAAMIKLRRGLSGR